MKRLFSSATFLLVSGIALFMLSNGLWTVAAAAWIAPVVLLRYVRGGGWKRLGWLLLLQVAAAHVMLWGIVPTLLGPLTYILIAYYGLLWWLPYAIDRWLVKEGRALYVLVFPAAAVAVEFANAAAFGSWGAIAYSQMELLSLLQVASVTGMWGVTFLVMGLASVVNHALEQDRFTMPVRLYAAVLLGSMLLGGLRLARPQTEGLIPVAGITYESLLQSHRQRRAAAGFTNNVDMTTQDRRLASSLLRSMHGPLLHRSRQLLEAGAGLVVWPEGGVDVLQEDEPRFLRNATEAARAGRGDLLLAYRMLREDDPTVRAENKAVYIDSTGAILEGFIKRHPVPGSTDRAGALPPAIVHQGTTRLGIAICYDMDFPNYVRVPVDVMLAPSWDWRAIDPLHTRMAAMRAVENGYSMVRVTGDGQSVAVDPMGRTLATVDYFQDGDATLAALVPRRGIDTIYGALGDWLAWLSTIGLALALVKKYR